MLVPEHLVDNAASEVLVLRAACSTGGCEHPRLPMIWSAADQSPSQFVVSHVPYSKMPTLCV
jgi:hypothetical protein